MINKQLSPEFKSYGVCLHRIPPEMHCATRPLRVCEPYHLLPGLCHHLTGPSPRTINHRRQASVAMALQKITFGDNLPGYEAGDKQQPAVIVIQEWFGVTDIVKKQAELISKEGFRVLVPDLYKGKIGVDEEEASHLMDNLDFQGAVKEIGQAAQYLKDTGAPKVGCTGFCMGGALSFAAGQHVPLLTCIAPCYGIPDARYFQVEQIKIPILGTFAANDKHTDFSGPARVEEVKKKITEAGGNIEVHTYATGVHGFLNQVVGPDGEEVVKKNQGQVASPEDVKAAWSTIIAFLKKHLQ